MIHKELILFLNYAFKLWKIKVKDWLKGLKLHVN